MAKSKPNNLGFRLEAAAFYGYAGVLNMLGLENASNLGAAIVPHVGRFTSAYKTSIRNIRMCFPNESEAWRHEVLSRGPIPAFSCAAMVQMTADESREAVKAAIAATGAGSIKDMGKVMAALKERYTGQMDFGKASGLVKELLTPKS